MNYKIEKALRYYAAQDGWRNATKLAFLRDPLNTLASTLSVYYRRQKEVEWVRKNLGLWCKLYDFIKNGEHDLSFVYANKYWSDSNYRDSVADYFGGGSASIPYVSRFARGGNTFFSRDKKAIVFEDIDNRYSAFQEDQIFKKICAEYYERFDRFLREVGDIKKTEFLKQLVV